MLRCYSYIYIYKSLCLYKIIHYKFTYHLFELLIYNRYIYICVCFLYLEPPFCIKNDLNVSGSLVLFFAISVYISFGRKHMNYITLLWI